jgi:hypothetical protein
MDLEVSDPCTTTCLCGKTFYQLGAFNCHKRTCHKTKKRLAGALAKAKEVWISRKRMRMEDSAVSQVADSNSVEMEVIINPKACILVWDINVPLAFPFADSHYRII